MTRTDGPGALPQLRRSKERDAHRRALQLGQAGADSVTFRGNRLAVTPIELDSVRAKKLRQEIPEALYESGKSQVSVRVPDDPEHPRPVLLRQVAVMAAYLLLILAAVLSLFYLL
mgnify:CR=1 FL=1